MGFLRELQGRFQLNILHSLVFNDTKKWNVLILSSFYIYQGQIMWIEFQERFDQIVSTFDLIGLLWVW